MKSQAPIGQITRRENRLEVEFRYSVEHVEAVKRFRGARFDRVSKIWSLPLSALSELESSPLFSHDSFLYELEEKRTLGDLDAVRDRLKADPFCVAESDIAVIDPEVVVRLNSFSDALRVICKFRSGARKLLERTSGVHYLKRERAYFFPVEQLTTLLRQLRDKGILFAVEEAAGKQLQESAELRAEILERGSGSAAQLRAALFSPRVVPQRGAAEEWYVLTGYTTAQLRECFPDAQSFAQRKELAARVHENELLNLVARRAQLSFRLWFSEEALDFIRARKVAYGGAVLHDGFADAIVAVQPPPCAWICDAAGRAGLLLSRELLPLAKLHGLEKGEEFLTLGAASSAHLLFAVAGARLPSLYQSAVLCDGSRPPASELFLRTLRQLEEQEKRIERMRMFAAQQDASCDTSTLSRPEIGMRLFPHQRVAISWLVETPRAFLGDDMGLGKTLSVLVYFEKLRSAASCDLLLVVCPNSLTRSWEREMADWLPALRCVRLPAEKRARVDILRKLEWGAIRVDSLVINYEAARLDDVIPLLERLLAKRRTLFCVDESQRVKNPRSKTFKALAKIAPRCERRVLLSGTPAPKDLSDIWAQMYLLDDGERLGRSYYRWLSSVAELGNRYSEYAVRSFKVAESQDAIRRVQTVLLRRRKEEVLSLPEKTFTVRDVELTGDQLKRYEEVRRELRMRLTSASGEEFVHEIQSILEEYLRAVQIASNPRLVDAQWKGEPAKFLELDVLVEEVVGEREEKLIIWTNYLGNVTELTERYKAFTAAPFSGEVDTALRHTTVERFQTEREPRILVAVPAAGGVGITLTAAQTAVYLDKTWNAEHWMQSIDRIHRIGQRGTVNIVSLHSGKIDDLIAANLRRKGREQARLLGDNKRLSAAILPTREELLAAVS